MSKIGQQAYRSGEIIRRLRNLLRKSEAHRSTVNINQLVQEAISLVDADARLRGLSIILNLQNPTLPILADRIQIEQVVLNLIRNVFDALDNKKDTPPTMTIETSSSSEETVTVSVSDNGKGFDNEDVNRLFDAFFTTKSTGMGMGLAISRSIVEAHGGRLWATSSPEGGATFWLALPVASHELNHQPHITKKPPHQNPRVKSDSGRAPRL